jgi:IS30 family transposase
LQRNSWTENKVYQASSASQKAASRHQEKPKKIYFTEDIKSYVNNYISEDYSPEQIAGFAKKEGLTCVSIERIYQYLWKDKVEGGEYYLHLRTQGKRYRKRGAAKDKRGQLDIDERPKIVDEKTRFGDLEIDLIIGEHHKQALLTINDRVTGMVKIRKVESKESVKIEEALIAALQDWKPFLHTITSDNGKEFACHAAIASSLAIDYYFAKPYHSWERGANENLNGLIRQYFPKKTSFINITNEQIMTVENKLNNRPRKRFGYDTPYEVYLKIEK